MKKNLLIIPGFGESTKDSPYQKLAEKYINEYKIITHTPTWNYKTATNWLVELNNILKEIDTKNTTVVAFSLGAYVTLLAAEIFCFKKIILCSLSPFFQEQLHNLPLPAKKFLGHRRVLDFSNHKIPRSIKCQAVFIFGSEDWSVGIIEARKLSKKYKSVFEIVPNTHHELTDNYLSKIESFL